MVAGLSIALALLAQPVSTGAADAASPTATAPTTTASATAYGPPAPPPPKKPVTAIANRCAPPAPSGGDNREIVVCAQRPQGYRLDPDIVEARREMRSGGRPTGPERMKDNSCASIGPMGCRGGGGINILAAAATAAAMAARLSKGQEIGSMFRTTPELSEYQLYLEAKHRREAREAEAAAKAKAAAQAAQQAGAIARGGERP